MGSMLFFVALAAHRFGRWPTTWATLALVMSADLFLNRMVGGAARSWTFPLVGIAAAALMYGRIRFLAVLVPFAAVFYPPASLICALSLALALFGLPPGDGGDVAELSPLRRLRLLAVVGGLPSHCVCPCS